MFPRLPTPFSLNKVVPFFEQGRTATSPDRRTRAIKLCDQRGARRLWVTVASYRLEKRGKFFSDNRDKAERFVGISWAFAIYSSIH